jgi:uncharacterized membrane protein
MRTARPLEQVADRLENAEALDGAAAKVQGLAHRVITPQVQEVLRGAGLGHPLHPALVAIPIGTWSSAMFADLVGDATTARRLTALGCIAAVPTAAAGAADWLATDGARRRVGFVHALVNDAALTCYALSWNARRKGSQARGMVLSMLGAGFLTAGGWLGGHLAYAQGVGVDMTSFLQRRFVAEATETQPGNVPAGGASSGA